MKPKQKKPRKMDSVYMPSLRILVDHLFQEAYNQQWTWNELAKQSGLSYTTIHNLGTYATRYPQLRTIQLIAHALGGHVKFEQGKHHKQRITWTPKVFRAA